MSLYSLFASIIQKSRETELLLASLYKISAIAGVAPMPFITSRRPAAKPLRLLPRLPSLLAQFHPDSGLHFRPYFRRVAVALALLTLASCASFRGIGDGNKIAQPDDFATKESIAGNGGNWPGVDWIAQFGDPQLSALIDEAMAGSPTLQQAQARINAANAAAEGRGATLLPSINAQASYIRNRFSETSIYPPPYGGGWYNSKSALLGLSYELDLWGKNQAMLTQAVSQQKAAQAGAQQARLALASSIAATYNQLAAEYALQDILQRTVTQRGTLQKITANRVQNGLDSQVERNQSIGSEADARAQIAENQGQIRTDPAAARRPAGQRPGPRHANPASPG
jgi:outer membrane protein TolC